MPRPDGGRGQEQEPAQSHDDRRRRAPLAPAHTAVEEDGQDGHHEQQIEGEHRLHHAQLAEAQGRRLQDELTKEEAEPEQPDPAAQARG